jgi:hypothetical protein
VALISIAVEFPRQPSDRSLFSAIPFSVDDVQHWLEPVLLIGFRVMQEIADLPPALSGSP